MTPQSYDGAMFPVPTSLSPSRVAAFTSCPMAFRFASIEQLPEPPSPHAVKGSLVHRALELLFEHPGPGRTAEAARIALDAAVTEFRLDPEYVLLSLDADAEQAFIDDSWSLVQGYFEMEQPAEIEHAGLELRLETTIGDLSVRGIIDRLDTRPNGDLVVVDYKTGKAPAPQYQQQSLQGVHFYSLLCQEVLGKRPVEIRLLYLRSRTVISATPTDSSVRAISQRTTAVHKAIERACTTGDFRPNEGPLCKSCAFKPWCPAFGGDPALAAVEAPARYRPAAA